MRQNRRADDLKSYAGDTALPGGKREKGDKSPEDTARREAYEEVRSLTCVAFMLRRPHSRFQIGLPRDRRRIPLLCTLEPFCKHNSIQPVLYTEVPLLPSSSPQKYRLTTSSSSRASPDWREEDRMLTKDMYSVVVLVTDPAIKVRLTRSCIVTPCSIRLAL